VRSQARGELEGVAFGFKLKMGSCSGRGHRGRSAQPSRTRGVERGARQRVTVGKMFLAVGNSTWGYETATDICIGIVDSVHSG
jgi:hypothetical protein